MTWLAYAIALFMYITHARGGIAEFKALVLTFRILGAGAAYHHKDHKHGCSPAARTHRINRSVKMPTVPDAHGLRCCLHL